MIQRKTSTVLRYYGFGKEKRRRKTKKERINSMTFQMYMALQILKRDILTMPWIDNGRKISLLEIRRDIDYKRNYNHIKIK